MRAMLLREPGPVEAKPLALVQRPLPEPGPGELRVAVTLRDVQGLEYREIADVLGVPIGTVESRIFRARQRLRPMLESLR